MDFTITFSTQMYHSMLFLFALFTFPFQPLAFLLVPLYPLNHPSLWFLVTCIPFPFLALLPIHLDFPSSLSISFLLSYNICTYIIINPDPSYERQHWIFVFCVQKYLTYIMLYKHCYFYPQCILCHLRSFIWMNDSG